MRRLPSDRPVGRIKTGKRDNRLKNEKIPSGSGCFAQANPDGIFFQRLFVSGMVVGAISGQEPHERGTEASIKKMDEKISCLVFLHHGVEVLADPGGSGAGGCCVVWENSVTSSLYKSSPFR